MADDQLKLALSELRLTYGRLDSSYQQVKTKVITFLGAGFVLLSYLYSGGTLFFPPELSSRVIYCLALGAVIFGIGVLLHASTTVFWKVPTENDLKSMLSTYPTESAFLGYLVEQYKDALASNLPKYNRKNNEHKMALVLLLVGGTILLVFKSLK